MTSIFSLVRFFALFGVLSSVIMAVTLYLAVTVRAIVSLVEFGQAPLAPDAMKHLLLEGIKQADALLVATALLVVGLGLYSLFIDELTKLPAGFEIRSFTSLKDTLIALVIAALGVFFFSIVVEGADPRDILAKGAATAAVILALAAYLAARPPKEPPRDR